MNTRTKVALVIQCLVMFGSASSLAAQGSPGDAPSNEYENHANRVEDMFKWVIGGGLTILGAVAAFQILRIENIKRDVTKKTKASLEKDLRNATECLSATIQLHEATLQLTREIADLEEPSIRHPVPTTLKASIRRFIQKVDDRKRAFREAYAQLSDRGQSEGLPEESAQDVRTLGEAYHYIGEYKEAAEYFEKECDLLDKELERLKDDKYLREEHIIHVEALREGLIRDRDTALRHLGNSVAGNKDPRRAIREYDKIKFSDDLETQMAVAVSRAHAFKAMQDYGRAVEECKKAKDAYERCDFASFSEAGGSVVAHAKRCYWEARYELANALTALGDYDGARKEYGELTKNLKDASEAVEPIWLYVAFGQCLWKNSAWRDAHQQFELAEKRADEAPLQKRGKVLYHIGRLYISQGLFAKAEDAFREIEDQHYSLDDECEILFSVFFGYARLKGAVHETCRSDGRNRIQQAITRLESAFDSARSKQKGPEYAYEIVGPSYNFAIGLALQGEQNGKGRALKLLRKVTEPPYNFSCVKAWAKAAGYSDFIELKKDLEFLDLVGDAQTRLKTA